MSFFQKPLLVPQVFTPEEHGGGEWKFGEKLANTSPFPGWFPEGGTSSMWCLEQLLYDFLEGSFGEWYRQCDDCGTGLVWVMMSFYRHWNDQKNQQLVVQGMNASYWGWKPNSSSFFPTKTSNWKTTTDDKSCKICHASMPFGSALQELPFTGAGMWL